MSRGRSLPTKIASDWRQPLDAKFSAAFDAATLQDGAASLASNPSTKSVRACAVTCVWLVRSFWHISVTIPDDGGFDNISPLLFDVYYLSWY